MANELRNRDFKLGIIHGKINPTEEKSEATIQRNVYLLKKGSGLYRLSENAPCLPI